jgi:uncharacterized tellurite resistance protein B-like protein
VTPYDIDTLKLAFSRHILDRIARADEHVHDNEQVLLGLLAPEGRMRDAGFLDDAGELTPEYDSARARALERLPVAMSLKEKLDLVSQFLDMCIVDGHIDRDEGSALFDAAQLLGVTPQQFDRHLSSLDLVGEVELDEALDE